MNESDLRGGGDAPHDPDEPARVLAHPRTDAPPHRDAPLDAEAARAVEEARRAFHVAAEKAGIAARALSRDVRAGAAEAIEELAAIARAAHERAREIASEVLATTRDGDGPGRPGAPRPAGPSAGRVSERPRRRAVRLEPHLAGALAYAGWAMTGLLFYVLTDPSERFVRFHAVQSILLTAALALVGGSVLAVPLVGGALFTMAMVGFLLVWLCAMWKALKHEQYPLPFIGELARGQVERGQ